MKKFILKHILLCVLILFPVFTCGISNGVKAAPVEITQEQLDSVRRDSIKQLMVDEVTTYIGYHTSKSSDVIPAYLVEKCLESNIQIAFALSQTHLETCFGTAGIGKSSSRKSIFGVMRTYTSYEDCIDGYINLLKKQYLVNGKTEEALLKHYVSRGGYRYGGENYENHLRIYYNKVNKKTRLLALQEEYNNI